MRTFAAMRSTARPRVSQIWAFWAWHTVLPGILGRDRVGREPFSWWSGMAPFWVIARKAPVSQWGPVSVVPDEPCPVYVPGGVAQIG